MWMTRCIGKTKMALFMACALTGGTLFASCTMTDIRDNLIAGSLAAVRGAATNWVGSLFLDFTEFVQPFPGAGQYIVTRPDQL